MAQLVTISSITAATPVDLYYCDSMSANCQFVASVTTFPYSFTVPSPEADVNFIVKLVDSDGCIIEHWVYVISSPTPTTTQTGGLPPTPTPTNTATPTNTQTPTKTPIVTPSRTPPMTPLPPCLTPTSSVSPGLSPSPTNSETPTNTPTTTETPTPAVTDTPTQTPTSTETPTPTNSETPTSTQTPTNTTTPTSSVSPGVSPSPTTTNTETPTNTPTESPTNTPTNTQTPTESPTNTPSETPTNTPSETPTNTPSETPTQTPTNTETPTNTPSETLTQTPTNTQTPTPTITPTTPITIQPIDILFVDNTSSKIYGYNPSTSAITYLFSATTIGSVTDIAATQNKIFLSNPDGLNTKILTYSYTASPFNVVYETTTTFIGYSNSVGMCAINNNFLVLGYSSSENIDRLDLSAVTGTTLFTLPASNFVTGDIVVNSGQTQYGITYSDTNDFTFYAGLFDSSGTLQSSIDLGAINDMLGIYAYNNKLWGVVQDMGIYYLNFTPTTSINGPTQPINYAGQTQGGSSNTTTQISWSY